MPASAGPATQQAAATTPARPVRRATQARGCEERGRHRAFRAEGWRLTALGGARDHVWARFGRGPYRHEIAMFNPSVHLFVDRTVTVARRPVRMAPWPLPPLERGCRGPRRRCRDPLPRSRAQARRHRRRRPIGPRSRRRRGAGRGHRPGRRGHRRPAGDHAAPGGRARRQRMLGGRPDHVVARRHRRSRVARRRRGDHRPRRPAVRVGRRVARRRRGRRPDRRRHLRRPARTSGAAAPRHVGPAPAPRRRGRPRAARASTRSRH